MNTGSLQKHFRTEYEEFFAKNDLVLSGCFKLSRSPVGIGDPNTIFSIKQKIPTKCYLWFAKNNTNTIIIDDIAHFNLTQQNFTHEKFANVHKQHDIFMQHIHKFLEKNPVPHWYTLSIISENMRGHGVWFSWALWALIALWLFLLTGKVTSKDLEDYDKFLQSDIYNEICLFARELDFIARYGNSLGLNSFCTFISTPNPVAFFVEYLNSTAKTEEIKSKRRFYRDLLQGDDKETMSIQSAFPMDYAMIFSGQESHTDSVEYYRNKDLMDTKKAINQRKDIYYKKWRNLPSNKAFDEDFIANTYDNNLMILNFRLLDSFKHIIHDSYNIQNVQAFSEVINDYRRYSAIIEKQSEFAEDFIALYKTQSKNHLPILWIMPVYSGKFWGWYLAVIPKGTHREVMDNTIQHMQEKYPDCMLEYASRIDGNTTDGVKIEQYISDSIFSSYIQKDKVYVRSTVWKNYLGDYNEIVNSMKTWLVLNVIENKIYFDGKKLTSDDVKSQTTTINILCTLVDKIGTDVANKELDISSYSKNKNEMLGKIVIPLIEFLEKKTGKKLPLICKGSIYDFYVKLNPTEIPIYIISKI